MINEYFIEPTVLYSLIESPEYRTLFLAEFGIGTPRFLSSFPYEKKSKLKSSLMRNMPDRLQGKARIIATESIIQLCQNVIKREPAGQLKDLDIDWIGKAQIEDNKLPPDLVITIDDFPEKPHWLGQKDLLPLKSLWDHKTQLTVKRNANDLSSAVSKLLRYSNEIRICDRFLYKANGIKSLQEFFIQLKSNRLNDDNVQLTLMFDHSKSNVPYVQDKITESLSSLDLDFNVNIEIMALTDKDGGEWLHHRYVITELGSISFLGGMDEGKVGQTDTLHLSDVDGYIDVKAKYWNAEAFEIIDRSSFQL